MRWNARTTRSTTLLCGFACAGLWLLGAACNRDETPAPPAGAAPATATAPAELTGVDAKDDPQAPRALPDTRELSGWVKTEPIRRISIDELQATRNDPALAKAIRSFPVDRIWTCKYTSPRGEATATLFEVANPVDAFGLFSILTHKPGITVRPQDGAMLETELDEARVLVTGWTGKACAVVDVSGFNEQERRPAAERFAHKILFSIPSADPPLIAQIIPRNLLSRGKIWMVHRTTALATDLSPGTEFKPVAEAGLDQILGLTGGERLWIAAVTLPATQPSPGSEPAEPVPLSMDHLVWIAEYRDEADARGAYERYQKRLASPTTDLDRETHLCEPAGPYLVGTWTAKAEAANPVLPSVIERLPVTTTRPSDRSPGRSAARPASVPQ